MTTKFLKIDIQNHSKKEVLEKIKKYIQKPDGFFHIVSLNPENVVIAQNNTEFLDVLNQAQMQIVDGVGVALGCSILGINYGVRIAGVDLMEEMLAMCRENSLRVLFLGGRPNLANYISDCYQKKYPQSTFKGVFGISNIQNSTEAEKKAIFSIVAAVRPQIIFAAFGSPGQELFFSRHSKLFEGAVCMGVGGGFDFLAGKIPRAPKILRIFGVEWLYRLLLQPWRWKRQLRLLQFIKLVSAQKFHKSA
jgi:N-acetylglucosaminyldiphosphoundecaprenol N-acetyl-beta-D-mannosaminyltransferase